MRSVQFSGVDGTALRYRNLAMPAGRASMQMALTSQGRSASALIGRAVRQRDRDAGIRQDRRARSARLRGRGPRQRQRAGDGRRQAEADRRAGAGGRRIVGRVGADSVHHQGRPASRRRHHARCQWRSRRRLRRIRYSRRSGRHPRRARADDRRSGGRPSGDSIVCGRNARCAQSHRRRRSVVVLAGGADDRPRNPTARCHRARRTAAAAAGAGVLPPPWSATPSPEAARRANR